MNLRMNKTPRFRRTLATCAAAGLTMFGGVNAAYAGPYDDARAAYSARNYTEAARILEAETQADPNTPRNYVLLGSVRAKQGDRNGAREAWGNVLRLDPELRSVKDNEGFLRAYRQAGGQVPSGVAGDDIGASANNPPGPRSNGSGNSAPQAGTGVQGGAAVEIIGALTNGNVYIAPQYKSDVDAAALDRVASATTKIVVLPTVYPFQSPTQMASELRKRLNLGEGVVLVATPKRFGASSGRLSEKQIKDALAGANIDAAISQRDLTLALTRAAQAVSGEGRSDRNTDNGTTGLIGLLVVGGVGGWLISRNAKKKRLLAEAKAPVEALHRQTLDNLSYVDGYLDLLPAGADADRARSLRASGYEEYAAASAILKDGKTPEDFQRADPMLRKALSDLEGCRAAIDKATGGTGVAMAIPTLPSLETDAEKAQARLKPVEQVRDEREAARLQQEVDSIPEGDRGVSFFSGQPLPASQLIPVTIVIGGKKRTVMASRDEANAIARGETPNVRAFPDEQGQYTPWYENRRYDPYRDYYGGWGGGYGRGGGLGTLVDLYLLSSIFGGGMFGGYGGWGYGGVGWGGPHIVNNNNYYGGDGGAVGDGVFGSGGGQYGGDAPVENAGGFDLFGQGGYDDTSAQSGSSGGGFFDSIFGGGGDSGGDSGGGGD